jgi:RNA polymerase sigma factor (sigma-70 family)
MVDRTDAELVDDARAGDMSAFGELVGRYQGQACRIAAAILRDPVEAEDAAQEAFLRALRNLDLLGDPKKFGAWLRRIVFGVAVDWLRAFRPDMYRSADNGEALLEVADPEPSALRHLESEEARQRILDAVARLPQRYRLPLTMFHLDGLSHNRVAEALGAPVSTVRSLVTRARQKLEPLLADVFAEQRPMKLLHLVNGESVAGTLRESRVAGAIATWPDILCEGPVPAVEDDDEFARIRAKYAADAGFTDYANALVRLETWHDELRSYPAYDEVAIWCEHDLFDQAMLLRVLEWFGRRDLGATALSLICIGSFPGVPRFVGLGQLTADQLASLEDTRQKVTAAQFTLAREAWAAFASGDPARIEGVLRQDTSALPFLAGAMRRYLEELPSPRNGLSRTEEAALRIAAARGPMRWQRLFLAVQETEERPFMGDTSFLRVLRGMRSLIDESGAVTAMGHSVLAGKPWRR